MEPKRFIFHYKFINIWHHICFLWSIDAHDVSTTSIRGDVWGCDVTWRRSHRLKQDQDQTSWTFFEEQMGPPALMTSMTFKWTSTNERRQMTPKTLWRLKSIKSTLIFMPETKRERVAHWLSVFNIVIFYFDNFDMIL